MAEPQTPGQYALNTDYVAAVEKAGGLPLPLPFHVDPALCQEYLDTLDGLLFTGGPDLDPSAYGQSWHPRAEPIHPSRQRFEFALLAAAEQRHMPILGICLGSQVMNVHRGGTLHQFLPELKRDNALEHRRLDAPQRRHPASLIGESSLRAALGKADLDVNTSHKQAVDQLGRGLRIIAKAPDGVIEGTEDPSGPLFLAVQWHPERLCGEADHLAIFRILVEAACRGGR